MAEAIENLRKHYSERIKAAQDSAANATDKQTIEGWKMVEEGYRQLLTRLPAQ